MKIWAKVFGEERVYSKAYFKASSVVLHRGNLSILEFAFNFACLSIFPTNKLSPRAFECPFQDHIAI